MADRVKSWDVEDPKTLRRALGANDHYVDDKYYKRFIPSGSGAYGDGTDSSLYDEFPTTILADAADEYVLASFEWPEFWSYGKLVVISYFYATTDGSVVLKHMVDEIDFLDTEGEIAHGHSNVIDDSRTIAWTTAAGDHKTFLSTSAILTRGTSRMFGIRTQRLGTDVADVYTASIHHMGWLIEWKPQPRQAP